MVFRILLLLLIVCLAFFITRLLLRIFMGTKPRLTCREDGSNLSLHKDPVCGVYLPESDSVVEIHGGKTYYYPAGNSVTLYTPTWRVSYYSYPDGELLAWETADRPYQSGESMSLDNTALDVNGKCVLTRRQDGLFLEVMDESLKLLVID
jgi:hypothetical protein